MCADITKTAIECKFSLLTAEKILISLMVSNCTCKDMIKFLAENQDKIAEIATLAEFIKLIENQDDVFLCSPAYPSYTGYGEKKPNPLNINAVKSGGQGGQGVNHI